MLCLLSLTVIKLRNHETHRTFDHDRLVVKLAAIIMSKRAQFHTTSPNTLFQTALRGRHVRHQSPPHHQPTNQPSKQASKGSQCVSVTLIQLLHRHISPRKLLCNIVLLPRSPAWRGWPQLWLGFANLLCLIGRMQSGFRANTKFARLNTIINKFTPSFVSVLRLEPS